MRLKRSIERVEKIINDPKYEDLKKLWNRKVWSLICEAKISTKVEKSFLSMLAETDVLGGLAI